MDSLKRVVKVEKSTPGSLLNLRRIFGPSSCGEIRALHASGFIEFVDVVGAERAVSLKLDIPGVRVLDVATQPRLVDQYRVINPFAFAEGHDFRSNAATGVRTDVGGKNRAPLGNPNIRRPDDKVLPSPGSSVLPETGLFLQALKSSDTPVSHSSGADIENRPISSNAALPSPKPPLHLSHSFPAASSASLANPFTCIENRVLMRLYGENISLDLSSLAGDPVTVIELLQVTASERANWLIVGAYYRRTGNPEGAKAVISAMLQALKQFNIPETDLKPAFLLLSGCEVDLGKIARFKGEPADKISEHYSNAQKWLHKVYGDIAALPVSESLSEDDPKTTRMATTPKAPASIRSRIDTSAPPALRSYPPSPNQRMMDREMQSLRDRYTHSVSVISDMRASKRKLENSFEKERDVRRRLERDLDEVLRERDEARRMEARAVDQMKRETESRRRAEDMMEEERQLRKRAENSIAMLQPGIQRYPGIPRMIPMAPPPLDRRSPEPYSAFDSHRLSF
ncbi:hypothetical protein DFH07DRAFT_792626 [Mycena maculata]|uniref:Uncharacterized protein n=1 Tax=Mycena maculata TaxID=230809 RepID=A0AAD7NYN4_9AGAR|nr:hypothetical protein DFH07DRAFT_792626 [Mycena maculata]